MRERIVATKTRRPMQRIARDEPTAFRVPSRIDRVECPKCRGTGKRSVKKGHAADCGCIGCLPCKRCNGTGRVEEERHDRKRNVEVEFVDAAEERDPDADA